MLRETSSPNDCINRGLRAGEEIGRYAGGTPKHRNPHTNAFRSSESPAIEYQISICDLQ